MIRRCVNMSRCTSTIIRSNYRILHLDGARRLSCAQSPPATRLSGGSATDQGDIPAAGTEVRQCIRHAGNPDAAGGGAGVGGDQSALHGEAAPMTRRPMTRRLRTVLVGVGRMGCDLRTRSAHAASLPPCQPCRGAGRSSGLSHGKRQSTLMRRAERRTAAVGFCACRRPRWPIFFHAMILKFWFSPRRRRPIARASRRAQTSKPCCAKSRWETRWQTPVICSTSARSRGILLQVNFWRRCDPFCCRLAAGELEQPDRQTGRHQCLLRQWFAQQRQPRRRSLSDAVRRDRRACAHSGRRRPRIRRTTTIVACMLHFSDGRDGKPAAPALRRLPGGRARHLGRNRTAGNAE